MTSLNFCKYTMEWQKHCCQCLTNKSLHSSIAIYVLWSNYQQWWRTTSNLGFCSAWVTLSDYLSAAATVCPWVKTCLKLHLKLLISLNTHISMTSLLELDLQSWIDRMYTSPHAFMWWLYFVDMILAEFGVIRQN